VKRRAATYELRVGSRKHQPVNMYFSNKKYNQ